MMKKIRILAVLLFMPACAILAQNTIIDLEKFSELKVFDRVNVTLVKSSENKAIISGDDQDDIKIVNDDGLLKIRMDFDEFLDGNETLVELHYTEDLNMIDANEGAKVSADTALNNNYLVLKSQEGAQLRIAVDARNLDAKAITGGKIWVTGKAPNQEATVRSGGEYHAKDLTSQQTDVSVFAGGKAFVNSKEYVEANVTAGGTIEIFGSPEKVIEDKTFGGSIVVKK